MARVYARWNHYYTHFDEKGRRTEYVFPAGEWREVPDDVARLVTTAAPEKLVILNAGEDRPPKPEAPAGYETREVEMAPSDRMARPKRARR